MSVMSVRARRLLILLEIKLLRVKRKIVCRWHGRCDLTQRIHTCVDGLPLRSRG